MELNEIMDELKSLGKERTKKTYISNGAKEPVFGVTISAMKPIFKKIKYDQLCHFMKKQRKLLKR